MVGGTIPIFIFQSESVSSLLQRGIELEVLANSEWKPLISFSLSFASRVCLLIILKSRGKYLYVYEVSKVRRNGFPNNDRKIISELGRD